LLAEEIARSGDPRRGSTTTRSQTPSMASSRVAMRAIRALISSSPASGRHCS